MKIRTIALLIHNVRTQFQASTAVVMLVSFIKAIYVQVCIILFIIMLMCVYP